MNELIPFELLEDALSPVPRDFENIDIIKTYEKKVDGKIHVGFIAYINIEADDDGSVLRDEGYCIFTIGNDYRDDYISQKEERILIDDPRIPKRIRDKWIALMTECYEAWNLDDFEDYINGGLDEVCPSLKEIINSRLEKLRK